MRKLWVVLAVAACGGSSKPAMGPPPPPAKIGEAERPEPVERAPAAPPAASAAGPGGVAPGTPEISGDIDRTALKRVIQRNSDQIRNCYELALQKDPSLRGKVVVVFTIDKDGTVPDAKADGVDDGLDRCLETRFKTWQFPKGPAPVRISYPIVFTPQ